MNPITTLENLMFCSYKLHFPETGKGYDMAYYPVFSFYYNHLLKIQLPKIKSVFHNPYALNTSRFQKTTTGNLADNRLLGKAGTIVPAMNNSVSAGEQLWKVFDEMTEPFYTSHEFTEYLNKNRISSAVGYEYELKLDDIGNSFRNIFSGYVRFLVDDEISFLDMDNLTVTTPEDFNRSRNNKTTEIIINISPKEVIDIATEISETYDGVNITEDLNQFSKNDSVTPDLLEYIHDTLYEKSQAMFENIIGLKFVVDSLNEFN